MPPVASLLVLNTHLQLIGFLSGGKSIRKLCVYSLCMEVCSSVVSVNRRGQLRETEKNPVQIHEVRFVGKRKYNRGRMLNGDHPAESNESDAEIENNRNHGRRIDGPWVFGLRLRDEVRYFYVERRDRATLLPIIQREVEVGSSIHSDECQFGTIGLRAFNSKPPTKLRRPANRNTHSKN
ncbi:hypothetical protein RN001_008947 [Aquatica leii]|uniref:Uncharacterized protein n=1 Tax=Aquatica leii TaxID=1421715 RepID=A0AAN7S9Y5_9COLE|nr:hypothetical protein RN001_008947 [Aquatica leii]